MSVYCFLLYFVIPNAFFTFNCTFYKKKVEILLGEHFLKEKVASKYKSLLALLIFLLTISTLGLIDAVSLSLRVQSQLKLIHSLTQESGKADFDQQNLDQISQLSTNLQSLPEELLSTGGNYRDIKLDLRYYLIFM